MERSLTVVDDPDAAVSLAPTVAVDPPQVVLFDLSYPGRRHNGLDIIVAFSRWCPESALVMLTTESGPDRALLPIAWSALQPFSVISRATPRATLLRYLDDIFETGRPVVEPRWKADLDARSTPSRNRAAYERLVLHAGHASLWSALIESDGPPRYCELATRSGYPADTLRNYRSDLLAPLAALGFHNPSLDDLFELALLIRPLLEPVLQEKLGAARPGQRTT